MACMCTVFADSDVDIFVIAVGLHV